MAELGNTSKCSVSKSDMKELYQDVPEELKNEGWFEGKRNGELKSFRKKETNRRMKKDPKSNSGVLTGIFADLHNLLSLLANMVSNTDRLFLLDGNIHGATSALINYVMKQKQIKQTVMMYI
jgi:hypothetical protein